VEKHVEDATKRLSDIESRMDSIGPSHAELLGDVEALAEKVGAIEKQLADMRETYNEDGRFQTKINCNIKERLCILEGERPEVCESPQTVNVTITDMCGAQSKTFDNRLLAADWAKKVLDGMWEVRRT
jgi:hypothetical protein